MICDIRYIDMDALDLFDVEGSFPEMDENFFLPFCDQPATDLSEISLLSLWESFNADDSELFANSRNTESKIFLDSGSSDLPQLFANPSMCEREIQLAKLRKEHPWMFYEEHEDTAMDRAERVFHLIQNAARTWLTDLVIVSKIYRVKNRNKLVVWLDYPLDTCSSELTEFSIGYDNEPRGGLRFYGLVCRTHKFDPRGKLFLMIGDKQQRYKGVYRWNKVEVIQIFRRGGIKTKMETSKQDHDRESKRRRKEDE